MRVYRIAKAIHSASSQHMMSGVGGLHGSGRWHTIGHRIVYAATSVSLATLEIAVNLKNPIVIPAYRILEVEVPDHLVVTLDETVLPKGWDRKDGEPLVSRAIGNRWLEGQISVGLQIPSSVIPKENNVLLNPLHPEFTQVSYGNPVDFPFDTRIKE